MQNFVSCLAFTLTQEGGWSNDPADPGGCTMEGIILSTYQSWKNDLTLTCNDLQNITSDEVSAIYQQNYWNHVQGDDLPNGVDLMVFDEAVNAGVGGSAKLLQEILNVTVDGSIGPDTLAAVANVDPTILINELAQQQTAYYQSLPGFLTFGAGWLNKVNTRQAAASAMVTP
jgi:lysozyme family protein